MAAISLRGYWRILIVFIACNPAMRMTKLTTIASTGRLMNRSVKDFIALFIAASRIDWRWIYLRFGCEIVVDRHLHAVAQLENAGAHNQVIRFYAVGDCHHLAPRFAQPHI